MGEHLLFSPSAITVAASIITEAVTGSIAHPANFLTATRKYITDRMNRWPLCMAKTKPVIKLRTVTYITSTSAVGTRSLPHPQANMAGLQMKCFSKGETAKSNITSKTFSPQSTHTEHTIFLMRIYLHRRGVGNLDHLFAILKETRGFSRNIPRPRRRLGEGINWLACSKKMRYSIGAELSSHTK